MSKPIAILTADWHIWGKAPAFRSQEQDWLGVLGRALSQIRKVQTRFGNIPVLVAGDIFDYYNPPPEVINWLIANMPDNVWAVPGQHDLQNHNIELLEKTAFWTLVKAHAINYAHPDNMYCVGGFSITGAGWNTNIRPPSFRMGHGFFFAHRYVYSGPENSFKGINEERNISHLADFLRNCKVAVFGDNHIPFVAWAGNCLVVNCGTLVCRKADEKPGDAGFYVLMDDFSIKRIGTFSEVDVFSSAEGARMVSIDMGFMDELENSAGEELDFESEVDKALASTNMASAGLDAAVKELNNEILRSAKQ